MYNNDLHVVDYFKELPFYNKRIEKPRFKRLKNIKLLSELPAHWKTKVWTLKNIKLLSELPFYEELNVIKTNHAFRRYAISYKIELVEKKDPINQLEASKSSIKDLFSDLLNKTKGFKCQITLKVVLKNTSQMEKLNFDQLISIQQQKQW